jgi:elongation factor P
MYVFMDAEYNQYEVEAENMGDAIQYLEDGMQVEVTFYDGKAISALNAHQSVVREIEPIRPSRATPRARYSSRPRSKGPASRSACRSS